VLSRPRKYVDGTRFEGAKFPVRTSDRLRELPNRSEFLIQAVEEKLGLFDDEHLINEIRDIDQELSEIDARAAKLRLRKSQKEALLRTSQSKINRSHEARLRLLETSKNLKNPRGWLESRIDVVAECDFKSVDEALVFLTSNQVR